MQSSPEYHDELDNEKFRKEVTNARILVLDINARMMGMKTPHVVYVLTESDNAVLVIRGMERNRIIDMIAGLILKFGIDIRDVLLRLYAFEQVPEEDWLFDVFES